jgi:phosphoserine phosphatase RsbU/P
MLPRGTHRDRGVQAFGRTRPANTVGGDFYDILPLADGRLVVALGDVAGKGSPAALLMALLLAILRTLIDEDLEPADLMARLNVQVTRHAPGTRFITLFLALYDPATGALQFVNAGHLPPLLRREAGDVERLHEGGVALGLFEHSQYRAGTTRLDPGDLLVLYSDGITEAEDPSGQPFEEAGLERVVAVRADMELEALGADVFDAVARHARDQRFVDDLTVLLLRRDARVAVPANTLAAAGV